MKQIQLTKGYVTQVDDSDFDNLNKYKWCLASTKKRFYAVRKKGQAMHRIIMDAKPGQQIDHMDGDGLNNTRSNLRFCTTAQNNANSIKRPHATSRFKGVSRNTESACWEAYICVNKKKIHLGHFQDEFIAAHAYDLAALSYYGEFARPNFPTEPKTKQTIMEPR